MPQHAIAAQIETFFCQKKLIYKPAMRVFFLTYTKSTVLSDNPPKCKPPRVAHKIWTTQT